jgi:hypothetical protein
MAVHVSRQHASLGGSNCSFKVWPWCAGSKYQSKVLSRCALISRGLLAAMRSRIIGFAPARSNLHHQTNGHQHPMQLAGDVSLTLDLPTFPCMLYISKLQCQLHL